LSLGAWRLWLRTLELAPRTVRWLLHFWIICGPAIVIIRKRWMCRYSDADL
jgi:hypothetical protein